EPDLVGGRQAHELQPREISRLALGERVPVEARLHHAYLDRERRAAEREGEVEDRPRVEGGVAAHETAADREIDDRDRARRAAAERGFERDGHPRRPATACVFARGERPRIRRHVSRNSIRATRGGLGPRERAQRARALRYHWGR